MTTEATITSTCRDVHAADGVHQKSADRLLFFHSGCRRPLPHVGVAGILKAANWTKIYMTLILSKVAVANVAHNALTVPQRPPEQNAADPGLGNRKCSRIIVCQDVFG